MAVRREEPRRALVAPGAVGPRRDSGMVTAELAVALPAVVLVALFALSGLQVAMTQLRCRDAAGVAARLAARGESEGAVSAALAAAAPSGTRLGLRRDGEIVEADVSAQVSLLGIGRLLPQFTVTATAAAVDDRSGPP